MSLHSPISGSSARSRAKLSLILLGLISLSAGAQNGPNDEDPHPETLRVMTYNIWYVFNHGKAQVEGKQWVASQTPDVVALQELTNIKPAKLQELATAWGHPHSSLLKTRGFSVGLTSRWPIETIEKNVEGMHHGYLHAKTGNTHYFTVHLSPFRWSVRLKEADILLSKIKPLLDRGEDVIVLGDFNACSPADKRWLAENPALLEKTATSDKKHDHVENLRDGKIDFSVMEKFLAGELSDTASGKLPENAASHTSFPTGILSNKKTAVTQGQRIDFILCSRALLQKVERAAIVTEGTVNSLSDHYPVLTDFKVRSSRE